MAAGVAGFPGRWLLRRLRCLEARAC